MSNLVLMNGEKKSRAGVAAPSSPHRMLYFKLCSVRCNYMWSSVDLFAMMMAKTWRQVLNYFFIKHISLIIQIPATFLLNEINRQSCRFEVGNCHHV